MEGAVAALQIAARQLQATKAHDKPGYTRIVSQLRQVADQLSKVERRGDHDRADQDNGKAVDYIAILQDALQKAKAFERSDMGLALLVPDFAMVEGPASDLRNVICGLVEYALTVGCDAITLRADENETGRRSCATEFVLRSPEFPDFLQRNLWKAVCIRHGEMSTVVDAGKYYIRFKIPIDRRASAPSPVTGHA